MSEVIDNSFKSVEDLKDIDSCISQIEKERSELQSQVSKSTDFELEDSWVQSSDKIDALVERLPQLVKKFDLEQVLSELNVLEQEYGSLQIFQEVKVIIYEKQNVIKTQNSLKEYGSIIEKLAEFIPSETSTAELLALLESIKKFKLSEYYPNNELSASLTQFLNQHVQGSKLILETKLKELVKTSNWVKAEKIDSNLRKSLIQVSRSLCIIQAISGAPEYPETLWALDIIAEPFLTRFTYHFERKAETNRLDKPEWALNYLETFLENNVTNGKLIFNDLMDQTPFSTRFFVYEFISSLLHPIRQKMQSLVSLIDNPRLLTHLIFELQNFDNRLKTTYLYNPYILESEIPSRNWHGLTKDILANNNVFDTWLKMEKELAFSRYESLVEADNAFHIDLDSIVTGRKPTHSAVGMKVLIDNITSHYKNINIVKYQLKFVSLIQLKLLHLYYERLNEGYEAFQSAFSSRLINNKEDLKLVQGLEGVERLCRLYCSLKYITESMKLWGEELIFLQLWNAFKNKGYNNKELNVPQDTLFSTLIDSYSRLCQKILTLINSFFSREIYSCLKNYSKLNHWSTLTSVSETSVSSELSQPLNKLLSEITFLGKVLSDLDTKIIFDELTTETATTLISLIIKNNQFNKKGTKQLSNDIEYIWDILNFSKQNKKYLTLLESIKVLNSTVQDIGASYNDFRSYRRQANFIGLSKRLNLGLLSDHEINDLLSRIV